MLFLANRILELELVKEERLGLLDKLQERGFVPVIRSTRLRCYEQMLSGHDNIREMEQAIAAHLNSEDNTSYVSGDLFCFEDYVLFLLFEELEPGLSGMRAGIVYERQTKEPLRRLESFCRDLSLCLAGAKEVEVAEAAEDGAEQLTKWRPERAFTSQGFMRFVAKQDVDSLSTIVCKENAVERVRAAELLNDDSTRLFLRRAREAYSEGFPVNLSTEETVTPSAPTMNKLAEVGLLRREVLISCRKSGHTLFTLPSADALAVITISDARCSECGAAIADEKIEEVVAPTPLSSLLLEDGAWMVNRLHTIIRQFGIPESEIVIEPPSGDGEARLLVSVCGVPFLIVMRDGDLTPAFARRAVNKKIETEAIHLVVVVTGAIHKESRLNLLSFAKRLTRGGNDFELIIAGGMNTVTGELRAAFERASRRALTEQLCALNDSFGLDVAHFIATRFQLLHNSGGTILPARLSGAVEPEQDAHKTTHATASIFDLKLLTVKEGDETMSLTQPNTG